MSELLPLVMVPEGQECRVYNINAGRGLSRRLVEMGFVENTPIRVLSSNRGSLIVALNGGRYCLSRGIAMKIMVS